MLTKYFQKDTFQRKYPIPQISASNETSDVLQILDCGNQKMLLFSPHSAPVHKHAA